jgi:hypothetical protein
MPDLSLGQCPHTLRAGPGPLFLLDPEREAFFDVDRPACRLLASSGEDLLPLSPHAIRRIRCLDFARSRVWSRPKAGDSSDLSCVTHTCQVVLTTGLASVVDVDERA